jgi:pimeloyl-ACP methyl ester carboxylesterase
MGEVDGVERRTTVARLGSGVVEYRLERRGEPAVVVFHGGHMRAGLAVGERVFAEAGYTVVAPSRPGYGRTPVRTGRSVPEFADVIRALCDQLGITEVTGVVGISGGGPAAVAMAACHPELVQRLILQCALAPLPWPTGPNRLIAPAVFAPATERATWGAMAAFLRLAPGAGLRLVLRDLSTLPARDVEARLAADDRVGLIRLFSRMRSGHGFRNDLRATPDLGSEVGQRCLVIASRNDGSVPFAHAEALTAAIGNADLVESQADSHMIWLGPDWPAIAETIHAFLATDPI